MTRPELSLQRLVLGARIRTQHVDQEAEDSCALDVTQEPDSEAASCRRALDETGNVGHHEGALGVRRDDAQVGGKVVNG